MCGINGFNWGDLGLVRAMNKALRHRGPDDSGVYVEEGLSLGHTRFSILDLSERGHQPMGLDKNGRLIYRDEELQDAELILVLNGEIYNFRDIRQELGEECQSGTDAEVVLRAYRRWGENCVKRFNGMWGLCIYDRKKQHLFCSRDRLGVKPLYYLFDKGQFAFSSELKGLFCVKPFNAATMLNKEALEMYFASGFIPSPHTISKQIFKLEGGHNLIFDLQKRTLKKQAFWELPDYKPVYDKQKLIHEVRGLLRDATRLRMIADVPVGAFLSGGLDSSAVVGMMASLIPASRIHTCSIGFESGYDETKYVQLVREYYKTSHHHYYFKESDFRRMRYFYPQLYHEPLGDSSCFPTLKLSQMAAKYMRVALSGDGGDEVFGGYFSHLTGARLELLLSLPRPIRRILSALPFRKNLSQSPSLYLFKELCRLSLSPKQKFHSEALPDDTYKPKSYRQWSEEKLNYSLKKGGGALAEGLRVYDLLFNTLQDNFLVKVDRASMSVPLEVRSPFLDYRFAELSQKIPTEFKTSPFGTKLLMREAIKPLVPKGILKRGKQGFEPPLEQWVKKGNYTKDIKRGLELLKVIKPDIAEFYETRVMQRQDRLNLNYKIRLLLFSHWAEEFLAHR